MIVRKPAAAGRFYARFSGELTQSIHDSFVDREFGPGQDITFEHDSLSGERNVLGAVCPHAGYVYSGSAAAFSLKELFREAFPQTVIILGTQHTGYYDIGLMKEGFWETPLGKVEVDAELGEILLAKSKIIKNDDSAFNGFPHGREHCIEVQIPLLQYCAAKAKKPVKIVPIKIGVMDLKLLAQLGANIADSIKSTRGKDIAIIASSDMTHFQPRSPMNPAHEIEHEQKGKDYAVIEAFEKMEIEEMYRRANSTTVCGPQTIATLLYVGKALGYKETQVLKYYTSFEKMGSTTPCDYSVGYFSGIVKK